MGAGAGAAGVELHSEFADSGDAFASDDDLLAGEGGGGWVLVEGEFGCEALGEVGGAALS